jgi:adenylate kinase family enzyme
LQTIIIFGNSGSGKSTLAKRLCAQHSLAHLDLDTLAWQTGSPPQRKPLEESAAAIRAFTAAQPNWVIEGCYSDLLALVADQASELVFMDLAVARCQANARQRPWEPHKYASKQAQDDNLAMLLDWIADYPQRNDSFSLLAHRQLWDRFSGKKTRYTDNPGDA